ncbi:MAG: hypothetical protein ACQEXN_11065 [Actinomycetota bacterium]
MSLGDINGGDNAEKQDGPDKQHGDKLGGLADQANDVVDAQQEQHSGRLGEPGNTADEFIDGQQEHFGGEGQ